MTCSDRDAGASLSFFRAFKLEGTLAIASFPTQANYSEYITRLEVHREVQGPTLGESHLSCLCTGWKEEERRKAGVVLECLVQELFLLADYLNVEGFALSSDRQARISKRDGEGDTGVTKMNKCTCSGGKQLKKNVCPTLTEKVTYSERLLEGNPRGRA